MYCVKLSTGNKRKQNVKFKIKIHNFDIGLKGKFSVTIYEILDLEFHTWTI